MLKPNWDELMAWIHAHNAEDRAHLTTAAAAMPWNLAAKETSNTKEPDMIWNECHQDDSGAYHYKYK